jgi:hypothetical protein
MTPLYQGKARSLECSTSSAGAADPRTLTIPAFQVRSAEVETFSGAGAAWALAIAPKALPSVAVWTTLGPTRLHLTYSSSGAYSSARSSSPPPPPSEKSKPNP